MVNPCSSPDSSLRYHSVRGRAAAGSGRGVLVDPPAGTAARASPRPTRATRQTERPSSGRSFAAFDACRQLDAVRRRSGTAGRAPGWVRTTIRPPDGERGTRRAREGQRLRGPSRPLARVPADVVAADREPAAARSRRATTRARVSEACARPPRAPKAAASAKGRAAEPRGRRSRSRASTVSAAGRTRRTLRRTDRLPAFAARRRRSGLEEA
jgi:hypothetical protein